MKLVCKLSRAMAILSRFAVTKVGRSTVKFVGFVYSADSV